ncbi:MAG: lipoyl(octanoyl) transferase LipB [Bacteroidales bacterium]
MKAKVQFEDLGKTDYKEAWSYQEDIFNTLLKEKRNNMYQANKPLNYLLFCEHPHVFTLGKSGEENNFLINEEFLEKINATYYRINRGGDITYHGPGQIVGYPILDLEQFNLQVKRYIYKLEEAVITTLKSYGIKGHHLEKSSGVWLDIEYPQKIRKICAIGVRASHFVTMHGFAFNINTDLNYFNYINPCGFTDKGVTSMEKELGKKVDMEEVKVRLKSNIEKTFDMKLVE